MFDPITEKLIKDIPQFDDIDVERLPQLLSSVYAHIVSAKSQLSKVSLSWNDIESATGYKV